MILISILQFYIYVVNIINQTIINEFNEGVVIISEGSFSVSVNMVHYWKLLNIQVLRCIYIYHHNRKLHVT